MLSNKEKGPVMVLGKTAKLSPFKQMYFNTAKMKAVHLRNKECRPSLVVISQYNADLAWNSDQK